MMANVHPGLKIIVAIIAAIIVGNILDSLGWGIATFFITIFLLIWVWHWIFGSAFESKVELTEELETLLGKLEHIGYMKHKLPLKSRDWCNRLGLFVQFREMGMLARLEAGGNKYHSDIDASVDYSSGITEWKVKKYNPGEWEDLVNPTFEIANWLSIYGGLPEEYADAFNEAIEVYRKEGNLELPHLED